ncbi:MAG: hypothetical protein QOE76_1195 [Frankiales bacterium]|jgi:hypothetical protein|nr:hypothetical protein [Frankiales bacterium]
MTSSAETAGSAVPPRADDPRYTLREAMLAERRAYESMRLLVPDLDLPRERRRPLTAGQQSAIEEYQVVRERLEALRSARRSPLSLVVDQSL